MIDELRLVHPTLPDPHRRPAVAGVDGDARWAFRSRQGGRSRRGSGRSVLLALSSAAFLAAAAGVAGFASAGGARLILLDISASAIRGRAVLFGDLASLIRPALEGLGPSVRVSLVPFGGDAVAPGPGGTPGDLLARARGGLAGLGATPRDDETNFEVAFEALLRAAGRSADAVLVSDGLETAGDFRAALPRLVSRGIRVHARALPPASGGDLRVDALHLPRWVAEGETVVALALVAASGTARGGRLRWTIREGDAARVVEEDVFPGGEGLRVELPLVARRRGSLAVKVEWIQVVSDRFPENDAGFAACAVGEVRRVAVLGSAPFAQALRRLPWLEVVETETGGILDVLAGVDAIVLVDVRAERLAASATGLLEAVERFGLGLLVAGTRNAFGPGGYRSSVLRRILPVEPDPPPGAASDLLLLLDLSGSMEGEKITAARESLSRLASSSSEADAVRVASFASRLGTVRTWKAEGVGPEPAPAGSLFLDRPAGATDLTGSLAAAAAQYEGRSVDRRRRLFVVTDGRQEGTSETSVDAAARAARERGVELVLFAVGEDADLPFLDRLASASGGRTVVVRDLARLPAALAAEAASLHRGLERHPRRSTEIGGLPEEAPPTLARLRCALRPGAEALYASVEREPLLSFWKAGTGAVAAFCSTPAGEDAPAWAEALSVWGPLLSALSRPRTKDSLRAEPGRLLLEVEEDAGDRAEIALEIGGAVVRLERVGRRLFSGPWRPPAQPFLGAVLRGGVASRPISFSGSACPAEFRASGFPILEEVAAATGGEGPSSADLPPPPRSSRKPAAGLFAVGGILLLLLAAASARFPRSVEGAPRLARTQGISPSGR